jgi:PAS domain S-box-containing protein
MTKFRTKAGERGKILSMQLGIAVLIGWTIIILASFSWGYYQIRQSVISLAKTEARTIYEIDMLFRRWNAMHGGVYVPITDTTQPNPFLEIAEREITTPAGVKLTKMNPAYMIRQVHELGWENIGIYGHITSLNPIRPANAPDPWEAAALQTFETGTKEVSSIEMIDGEEHMRVMRPLIAEKPCLTCHAQQGYKEGDIRGGLSVSVPMKNYWAILANDTKNVGLVHGLLWMVGVLMIGMGFSMYNKAQDNALAELYLRDRALETATNAILMTDKNLYITYSNRAALEMWGYASSSEVIGKKATDFLSQDGRISNDMAIIFTEGSVIGQYKALRKNGSTFDIEVSASVVKDNDGHVSHLMISVNDITERKNAENNIKTALAEKETLLRELYHRTRNNMQVISAMLELESNYMGGEQAKKVFKDMETRIQSMSLVHQKLYQSHNLSRIDLKEYILDLISLLQKSYRIPERIRFNTELESVSVLIDTAIPIGLVLNELLSNAIKHAFPDNRSGEVTIQLIHRPEEGGIELLVADNGVGLASQFNPRDSETLGMQSIISLVEQQLRGHVEFDTYDGVQCHIIFADSLYKERV